MLVEELGTRTFVVIVPRLGSIGTLMFLPSTILKALLCYISGSVFIRLCYFVIDLLVCVAT